MRRRVPVAALALVVVAPLALAAAAGAPGPDGVPPAAPTAQAPAARVPLVAIARNRPARIVRLHSRTLRPASGLPGSASRAWRSTPPRVVRT
jgi:hypothetical protein